MYIIHIATQYNLCTFFCCLGQIKFIRILIYMQIYRDLSSDLYEEAS